MVCLAQEQISMTTFYVYPRYKIIISRSGMANSEIYVTPQELKQLKKEIKDAENRIIQK